MCGHVFQLDALHCKNWVSTRVCYFWISKILPYGTNKYSTLIFLEFLENCLVDLYLIFFCQYLFISDTIQFWTLEHLDSVLSVRCVVMLIDFKNQGRHERSFSISHFWKTSKKHILWKLICIQNNLDLLSYHQQNVYPPYSSAKNEFETVRNLWILLRSKPEV